MEMGRKYLPASIGVLRKVQEEWNEIQHIAILKSK